MERCYLNVEKSERVGNMETQRIEVTGELGFIGTNFVNELEKRGYFGSSVDVTNTVPL